MSDENSMELARPQQVPGTLQQISHSPVVRQLGLLLGVAASIALGVAVVLWSRTPDYSVLYSNVTGQDARQMVQVLEQYNIPYRLDPDSGMLMVAQNRLHEAKLKLAAENLANPEGHGFELIDKDQGFGSSSFVQSARYKRAQEGELAKTITSISAVQSARVHLALPKDSAFVRDRRKPSASVMVKLAPGRKLAEEQTTAIVNLVAASIPNMDTSDVTLIDDKGRLLSAAGQQQDMADAATRFNYTRKLEDRYVSRIENILSPLVGLHGVRAEVTADIDFTRNESTTESFNPDLPAVRSEQSFEEETTGAAPESGIPGALSNTPPGPAAAPQQATAQNGGAAPQTPSKSRRRTARNFELDKTISHTRRNPGQIRKLSVAVILDVPQVTDAEGNVTPQPYSDAQLARFTSLVKEAVGFNPVRGDSVEVLNAAFTTPEQIEMPEESLWEKPWFWSLTKQVLGGIIALVLLFGVLRPVLRFLMTRPPVLVTENGEVLAEDQLTLSQGGMAGDGQGRLPKPTSYEDNLNMAKQLAGQEPKRVAQVVKTWLED